MTEKKFTARKKENIISLAITGCDEPNNGRELWVADLQINARPANDLFYNHWNRLNYQLQHFQFASADEAFVFIPAESDSFLISVLTLDVFYMDKVNLSALDFRGNCFYQHKLIIAYRDFFTVYDPVKKEMQEHRFGKQELTGFTCQSGLFTATLHNGPGSLLREEKFLLL